MYLDPKILFFVGADGCGKSTLARFAVEELNRRGARAALVWSRFNNYLSKPLLALARLTGHNYYETHDGVRFGYHDFDRAVLYQFPFILAQVLDVNVATAFRLARIKRCANTLVFERGPWDTLADLILDTGCGRLAGNYIARLITSRVRGATVLWIRRSHESILRSRPELRHDRTLCRKIAIYELLAGQYSWRIIDNDRPLELVKEEVRTLI